VLLRDDVVDESALRMEGCMCGANAGGTVKQSLMTVKPRLSSVSCIDYPQVGW